MTQKITPADIRDAMTRKGLNQEIKRLPLQVEKIDDDPDAPEGRVRAVFSTFDVVDRDYDIVTASAIPDGMTIDVVWSHDWADPIGTGTITVEADRAVIEADIWLDTLSGSEAYKKIKHRSAKGLQQWSWGFRILDADYKQQDGEYIRLITKTEPFEVSPVLIGANQHTRTLDVKTRTLILDTDAPMIPPTTPAGAKTFTDQATETLAHLTALVDRAESLADLREAEGRKLTSHLETFRSLEDRIKVLIERSTPEPADPAPDPERVKLLRSLRLDAERVLAGINNPVPV